MATPEDDNSGPPYRPGGSHEPLSGLPPEWGRIIIPDDAAELEHEADQVRKEMHQETRHQRFLGLGSFFRAPFMIVLLTLLLALSSLFSIMGPLGRSPQATDQVTDTDRALQDISLSDEMGTVVRVGDHLPAVILLLDGCPCPELGNAVAVAAPPGVSILLVGRQPPVDSGPGIHLADPLGKIRSTTGAGIAVPTEAAVLLLDREGQLTRILPGTDSVEDFRTELNALSR